MTIMSGHEDLQPREVIAFTTDGHAVIRIGEEKKRYQLFMLPGGGIVGRPVPPPAPIDQLAERCSPTRWTGVDQL